MKKFIICALIAVSAMTVTITSCNKYPDGPKISLLTKKMRITGAWTIEKALLNGNDVTSSTIAWLGSSYVWTIAKDGTYTETGNFSDHGTWDFSSNKEDLIVTPSSGGSSTYVILKLKSKELWLQDGNSEIHYKQ